jgi:AcrR family transcriptional regulator
MNERDSGKRSRKIDPDSKRAAILAAAQEFFAARGYEATTIAAIAERAEVAVGSVHRIFGDKPRLLSDAQQELEAAFVRRMDAAWSRNGPLEARFRTMFEALFEEMEQRRHLMPLMALHPEGGQGGKAGRGSLLREAIETHMREAIAKGEFRSIPVPESAAIAVGMVDAAMQSGFAANDPEAMKRSISVLVEIMLRYVAAP